MAETANEAFLLAMIRHQIGLQRVAGSVREKIFELFDVTETDLELAITRHLRAGGGLEPRDLKRLERLLKNIRQIREPIWETAEKLTTKEMLAMTRAEPKFTAAAMTAAAPVALALELPSIGLLSTLVSAEPLDGRILSDWFKNMKQADLDRIMAQVRIGMVQGESIPQIVRRVIGSRTLGGRDALATEPTRRSISAVVRTLTNGLSNAAKGAFYASNKAIIDAEVWVATLDGRTCAVCQGLDGRRFPVGTGRRPPAHVGCRCVRVAVLDGGILGTRPLKPVTERGLLREFSEKNGLPAPSKRSALPRGFKGKFDEFARRRTRELTGLAPAKLTYGEFLRKQTLEFTEDVLGKTKARLFRTGKINIRRFTDRQGDTLTLKELAVKEKAAFVAAGLDPGDFV